MATIGMDVGVIARARGFSTGKVTVIGEPGASKQPSRKKRFRKKGKGRGWHGDSAGHRRAAMMRHRGGGKKVGGSKYPWKGPTFSQMRTGAVVARRMMKAGF